MSELADFTPAGTLPPVRTPAGTVIPGRHTTSQEQREQAIDHLLSIIAKNPSEKHEAQVRVNWVRGDKKREPTVLRVRAIIEHLGETAVFVMQSVEEFTTGDVKIERTAAQRLDELTTEVADLAARDML